MHALKYAIAKFECSAIVAPDVVLWNNLRQFCTVGRIKEVNFLVSGRDFYRSVARIILNILDVPAHVACLVAVGIIFEVSVLPNPLRYVERILEQHSPRLLCHGGELIAGKGEGNIVNLPVSVGSY